MSQADDIAEAIFSELEGFVDEPPPPSGPPREGAETWYPDLNPTQKLIFEDASIFILGHGEKASGKSIGFGHKIVRHAYENENALVLVISPSLRAGNEGIWYDLDNLILPAWKDGIGLEFTPSKLDPLTKDRHRWVKNRFGGWSKLLLVSIPYAGAVEGRVKGPAPSMVYVDELTNCDGREYFTFTAAQIGRRRGISGPQQWCASCNPEGPSHWVYKLFWDEAAIKDFASQEKWSKANGGKDHADGIYRDPKFSVYHVPISENKHRLPAGYVDNLVSNFRGDDILRRRLMNGEWIDRPKGTAIFKPFYSPILHVKGNARRNEGLRPVKGFPIYAGLDLGQVHHAITFLQCIPTKEGKTPWIIFDEIDYFNERILFKLLAREILQTMDYWNEVVQYPFTYNFIADESAVNQWHPGGEGSFDAWDLERNGDGRIKIDSCPKPAGSVSARVRLLSSKLSTMELLVSDLCHNTKEMFLHLDQDEQGNPKKAHRLDIHKFDSITYPMFKVELAGGRRALIPRDIPAPKLFSVGGGKALANLN